MRPITDWCKHKALIFDSHGFFLGMAKIKWKDPTFVFQNRVYNFLPSKSTFFKIVYIIFSTKYYLYHVDNSNPILLDGENKGIIDPVAYRRVLETDLIKKLNDLAGFNILSWIMQPKVIVVAIAIILILIFFMSGTTPGQVVNYISGAG
jgi:hypothetical protein